MTRALFIRFSSIGDLVLTAPAVAAFRAAVDGPVEVHFLTKTAFAPVVAGFGALVDVVHTVERSGSEAVPALKAVGFDHVVDLQSNVRSRAVTRGLGLLSTFRVDKRNGAKWALVHGFRRTGVSPIVERYVGAFAPAFAGAAVPSAWPALFEGADLPPGFDGGSPWSVIALGAAHGGKAVDRAVLEAAIAATPGRVVLVGGEAERALGEGLGAESWAGRTSVAESAALLRGARAVLAGDTGMMHLAAALGRPVVTVWGCTRPSLGMAVWRPAPGSADVLPVNRGGDRPCSKLGDRCRYRRDPGCSRHVRTVDVLAAWRAALS